MKKINLAYNLTTAFFKSKLFKTATLYYGADSFTKFTETFIYLFAIKTLLAFLNENG